VGRRVVGAGPSLGSGPGPGLWLPGHDGRLGRRTRASSRLSRRRVTCTTPPTSAPIRACTRIPRPPPAATSRITGRWRTTRPTPRSGGNMSTATPIITGPSTLTCTATREIVHTNQTASTTSTSWPVIRWPLASPPRWPTGPARPTPTCTTHCSARRRAGPDQGPGVQVTGRASFRVDVARGPESKAKQAGFLLSPADDVACAIRSPGCPGPGGS
jgi:hypothetical protein